MEHSFDPIREVESVAWKRIAIKTHLITFGESIVSVIKKYASPRAKDGDWIAISEKVISVTQNNVKHISTVKVGWLARLITRGVKKYKDDLGWANPPKMQPVV